MTKRLWRNPATFLVLLTMSVAMLILACAGPGQPPDTTNTPVPTPTPTPPPDPQAILARAAVPLASAPYLEFVLEHPVGGTTLAPGLTLVRAEGTASLPDRSRLALDMEASGTALKLGVIVVGEQAFMTNLFTGAWESVPKEQIPFRFEFVTEAVTGVMGGIEDASLLPSEELDGEPAYVIRGVGPTEALSHLIPGALAGSTIPVELWVDKADGGLRQVRVTGPLLADDLPDTVRVVRLKVLADAPEIEAPEVGTTGG